MTEPVKMSVCS